jgi:Spx/MgsR family transcriptional regulator
MASTTLYGIPNCDTVRRARAWLTEQGIAHDFHDFRRQGVPTGELDHWLAQAGWQTLLNRKGTTWRGLADHEKAAVTEAPAARTLMLRVPSVIKRPVVAWADGHITVGFDPAAWALR